MLYALRLWYIYVLHRGSNCSLSWAMDGHLMHHCIISSRQSAATSEIVKRCWSLKTTCVSSAIESTQTFTIYLYLRYAVTSTQIEMHPLQCH